MYYFTLLLRAIIGCVVLLVWSVFGGLLYIPLVVRQISVFSIVLSAASLGQGDIAHAQLALERAIQFYPRGFSLAMRVITDPDSSSPGSAPTVSPGVSLWQLAFEIFCSTFFWLFTAWLLGFRHWSNSLPSFDWMLRFFRI